MSAAPVENGSPKFKPFTKAERIQQLNDIDKSITQLLRSAGEAIQLLTVTQASESTPTPPAERHEAFEDTCNLYLKTLQSVDVRLHRQIWGLQEADIIPPTKPKAKPEDVIELQDRSSLAGGPKRSRTRKPDDPPPELVVVEGGMGNLDIGWLNSRSGKVERDMEAELWRKARALLEGLENGTSEEVNGKDHDMDGET